MFPPLYLGVTEWCYSRTDLTASEQALMLAIAFYANASTKVAEPSKATLQQKSKLKDKAYKAAAKGLQAKGIIKIHQRLKPDGKNDTNLFKVLVDIPFADVERVGVPKSPPWGSKSNPEIPITTTRYIDKDLGGPFGPPTLEEPESGSLTSDQVLSSDELMWVDELAAELCYDLVDQMIDAGYKDSRFRNDALEWFSDLSGLFKMNIPLAASLADSCEQADIEDLFTKAISRAGEFIEFGMCHEDLSPVRLLSYRFDIVLGSAAPTPPPEIPQLDPYESATAIKAGKQKSREQLEQFRAGLLIAA